jgi:protoheme IX farnesyltransferase
VRAAALAARSAAADYLELTKPRLTLFVLVVVLLSGWMAAGGEALLVLLPAVLGTGLVAAGASALNMVVEREHDARMPRTRNRPLPAGRLRPAEAALFGGACGVAGLLVLLLLTTPLACALAGLTLLSYVFVYTPLKRLTTLNTHVGAVPGALPALVGWAAVDGTLAPPAFALFLVVYLWQVPHFLSIAWIYRADYEQGGFKMLPSADPDGSATGRQAVLGALALLPVSLWPALSGAGGIVYAAGAVLLGGWFLWRALGFALVRTTSTARLLMRASLVYLPALLGLLALGS